MSKFTFSSETEKGSPVSLQFDPSTGMGLKSFLLGEQELLHKNCNGTIVGPRLHHPQSAYPFGVAQKAPWRASEKEGVIKAVLDSKEEWKGKPLSELERQPFTMTFTSFFKEATLYMKSTVVSESDSFVAFQIPFAIPQGGGEVLGSIGPNCYVENEPLKEIPNEWKRQLNGNVRIPLNQKTDIAFFPYPNPLSGTLEVLTTDFHLQFILESHCQETCWHFQCDPEASKFSIAALSTQNPWKPNLTVSSIVQKIKML